MYVESITVVELWLNSRCCNVGGRFKVNGVSDKMEVVDMSF